MDLESKAIRGPDSAPTRANCNILSLNFFHIVRPLMPVLALLSVLSVCEDPDWTSVDLLKGSGLKLELQQETPSS